MVVAVLIFVLRVADVAPPLEEFALPLENLPRPSDEWIRSAYTATTSLYIEVDREIWQIGTIFMASSALLMGWVVTNFNELKPEMVLLIGCASIMLVGMATLFKHRLRRFNLVHIESLRRLERAAVNGNRDAADYWGVHHMRSSLRTDKAGPATTSVRRLMRRATSIHGLIDIYLVLFTVMWLLLWLIKNGTIHTA